MTFSDILGSALLSCKTFGCSSFTTRAHSYHFAHQRLNVSNSVRHQVSEQDQAETLAVTWISMVKSESPTDTAHVQMEYGNIHWHSASGECVRLGICLPWQLYAHMLIVPGLSVWKDAQRAKRSILCNSETGNISSLRKACWSDIL